MTNLKFDNFEPCSELISYRRKQKCIIALNMNKTCFTENTATLSRIMPCLQNRKREHL